MMPPTQVSAFWITGQQQAELRPVSLPERKNHEVLVRSLYGAISLGTEMLVYNLAVPPSEYERMRCPFQEGHFPTPVKYGYSNVGVVEAGPAGTVGQRVFCLYPHQSHYVVPADCVHPLPTTLPTEHAVLAANMETAVNALWDSGIRTGDHVSVIGAGVVGCLIAWLAGQTPGCQVELIDINSARQTTAEQLGVSYALPATASCNRDLVFHTSASESGLATALKIAGLETSIVELSWYGLSPVNVNLGEAFHAQRLRLLSSQVGRIAEPQQARWNHRRRMALALSLLHDDRLKVLFTGESPFLSLPETFQSLSQNRQLTLCERIAYETRNPV